MSNPSVIDAFLSAVEARVGTLDDARKHELAVAAKNIRSAVESGAEVTDATWEDCFPSEDARAVARELLGTVSVMNLDFEATVMEGAGGTGQGGDADGTMAVTPEAVERKWHALLTSVPEDGLAEDGTGTLVDAMELGRMILNVSKGKASVDFARLPSAEGFRERFLEAARDSGRLDSISGLPDALR